MYDVDTNHRHGDGGGGGGGGGRGSGRGGSSSTNGELLEPPGVVVNVARGGTVRMSSTEGADPTKNNAGCRAESAIDGKASGIYHKTCGRMAISNLEDTPWIELHLPSSIGGDGGGGGGGGGHRVWSVEVWAGMRKCDSVKYGVKAWTSSAVLHPNPNPNPNPKPQPHALKLYPEFVACFKGASHQQRLIDARVCVCVNQRVHVEFERHILEKPNFD